MKNGIILGFGLLLSFFCPAHSQSIQSLSISDVEYFTDTISYNSVDSLPDGQYCFLHLKTIPLFHFKSIPLSMQG